MSEFSAPAEASELHNAALLARLQQRIASEGYLSFSDFMQSALYEPGLGYYVSGLRKFGEQGDFVTAPELSPLFAQCIARQAQEVLSLLDRGDVLEFGAGSGAMAAGLLLALDALECLPDRYLILEVSPDLRQRQRETLRQRAPAFTDRVIWLDSWPEGFRGFAIGNEVLDAMPVERFRYQNGAVQQAVVEWRDQSVRENFIDADADLSARVEHIRSECREPWADGFTSEINHLLQPWFQSFECATESAALLLIDYGYPRQAYYHPMRAAGTLRCHYRHHAHDNPYLHVGLQDITAHVDFTAVAEAATQTGWALEGFVSQQQFLFNCGMASIVEEKMANADEVTRLTLSRQVKQLTLPGEMGESFNVIGFLKNVAMSPGVPLRGFSAGDQTHRL